MSKGVSLEFLDSFAVEAAIPRLCNTLFDFWIHMRRLQTA